MILMLKLLLYYSIGSVLIPIKWIHRKIPAQVQTSNSEQIISFFCNFINFVDGKAKYLTPYEWSLTNLERFKHDVKTKHTFI